MTPTNAVVFVVDDDAMVRDSLEQLIKSVGLNAVTYSSTQAFLAAEPTDQPGCLVLDIRMPGMSGLDLQDVLVERGNPLPIIFITGHGTVPMSVRAMKAGAMDFLQKPFEDQALIDLIFPAIELNRQARQEQIETRKIEERIESLTVRERDVLALVAVGKLNKQIAGDLGISENTVKTHRARIMRKMKAESVADLVRATVSIADRNA